MLGSYEKQYLVRDWTEWSEPTEADTTNQNDESYCQSNDRENGNTLEVVCSMTQHGVNNFDFDS